MSSVERGKVMFYTEPNFEGIYVIYKEGVSKGKNTEEEFLEDSFSSIRIGQGIKLYIWETLDDDSPFHILHEGEYPNILENIKNISKFQILDSLTYFAIDVRFFDLITNEYHNNYLMTFKLLDIEELEIKSGDNDFKLLKSKENSNEIACAIYIKRFDNLYEPISNLIFHWNKEKGKIISITDSTNFSENLSIMQNDKTSFTFTLKTDGIGFSQFYLNKTKTISKQINIK